MSYNLNNIPSIGYIQKSADSSYSATITPDDFRDSGAVEHSKDSSKIDFIQDTFFVGRAVGIRGGTAGYLYNIGSGGTFNLKTGQIPPGIQFDKPIGSEEAIHYGNTTQMKVTVSTKIQGWHTTDVSWSKDCHIQYWRT